MEKKSLREIYNSNGVQRIINEINPESRNSRLAKDDSQVVCMALGLKKGLEMGQDSCIVHKNVLGNEMILEQMLKDGTKPSYVKLATNICMNDEAFEALRKQKWFYNKEQSSNTQNENKKYEEVGRGHEYQVFKDSNRDKLLSLAIRLIIDANRDEELDNYYYVYSFKESKDDRESVSLEDEFWPSKEEYSPNITVEQWIELLNDKEITSENTLEMLSMFFKYGKPASCSHLAAIYGKTKNYFNSSSSSYAKKIVEKVGCPVLDEEFNHNAKWWPVLYVGRDAKKEEIGSYVWKLRDELKEALEQIDLPSVEELKEMKVNKEFGLNTILYGPPGTGKTYNTAIYAVAICDGLPLEEVYDWEYKKVLERYKELKNDERIAFTTFHQSYGYEDFIEGIKPILDDEKEIGYSIEDGVFKDFCDKAITQDECSLNASPTIWKVSLEGTGDNPTRKECMENSHIRIGYDIDPNNPEDRNKEGWGVVNRFANKMKIGDIVFSCYSARTIDAIGIVTGNYEKNEKYENYQHVRSVKWLIKGINEDIVDINNGIQMTLACVYKLKNIRKEDALELVSKLGGTIDVEPKYEKPFVFIIDEINRGNISKIFGELITLIEDTKRAGRNEEASAILPYSKEEFSIPKNVYIIGTMNTADRSIAMMDTALRRRFKFNEMMPDTKLLEDIIITENEKTINVSKMLEVINERITFLYDREHTIGHAFLLPLKDNSSIENLANVFKTSIIPLLQEYFYEDYSKIQLVLGDNAKSDDKYKIVLDSPIKIREVFKGNPEDIIDLPEKKYSVQNSALKYVETYREIYE